MNYIPHYTKKKEILNRKEFYLEQFIRSNADEDKLVEAAEEVRDARIRVLNAKKSTIPPVGDDELYAEIDAKIEKASKVTVNDILEEFGC